MMRTPVAEQACKVLRSSARVQMTPPFAGNDFLGTEFGLRIWVVARIIALPIQIVALLNC